MEEGQRLNENVLDSLEGMMSADSAVSATQLQCLWTALNWPQGEYSIKKGVDNSG